MIFQKYMLLIVVYIPYDLCLYIKNEKSVVTLIILCTFAKQLCRVSTLYNGKCFVSES